MFRSEKVINPLLILICSAALVSCGSISKVVPQLGNAKDTIPITATQFDCGPAVDPLPDDETLKGWSSSTLLSYATDSWMWGDRCAEALKLNKIYFKCSVEGDKAACAEFKKRGSDGSSK